jgi:hypothetical protein
VTTGTCYRIRRRDAAGNVAWLMPKIDGQNSTEYLVDVPPGPGRYTYEICVTHYDSGDFSGNDVTFAYLTGVVMKR